MEKKRTLTLGSIICDVADLVLQQPERLSVSQAAEKYVRLNNVGSYVGPWQNSMVPYMVEPMDLCASREKEGVIFLGPSQSAKTASLALNFMAYTIMCDPMDFVLYEKSMSAAKDFSARRVDRMHRDSPDIRNMLLAYGRSSDNVFDKHYKNGVLLKLSWPSINEMSGIPVPRVVITDYDRMVDNVDGEGSVFDVARARIRTFRTSGKIVAESSPSRDQLDPHWKQRNKHEGPPCGGIVALYNRGDMRRFYWPCPFCNKYFEGSFNNLIWSASNDIVEASESAHMICAACHKKIEFDWRDKMNGAGIWLNPSQTVVNGKKSGPEWNGKNASFWLKGPAAKFSTWAQLVSKYIEARRDYENTGSQEALKTTTNTDQAEVYTPEGLDTISSPEDLQSQAIDLPKREVPLSVRFLFAQIDVQGGHWVVQVFGVQPSDIGIKYDIVYIDRFKIDRSKRVDENGDKKETRPAAHPEDWDLITEQVIDKVYPLENGEGHMAIWMTVCDSGGKKGTTSNAYAYWLRLRQAGKHRRFFLCKGDPLVDHPRVHIELPDAQRKDRLAQARGEIPIMFFNSNVLKDSAQNMLMRTEPGGRVYTPSWFPDYFYQELTVEVKTPKGWDNVNQKRNEAWDLLYYGIGQCVHLHLDQMDWDHAPVWARPWNENALVVLNATPVKELANEVKTVQSLASLGRSLA